MNIFSGSVEHWIDTFRKALSVWSFHRETGTACIISYESIVQTPSVCINSIAAYLGLHIQPEQVCQITEALSAEKLQRFTQKIDRFEHSRVVRKDGYIYDRQTLLHQNHIRDGRIGHGAGFLDSKQLAEIDALLREEGFEFLCTPPKPN